jgi:hypothetical protein
MMVLQFQLKNPKNKELKHQTTKRRLNMQHYIKVHILVQGTYQVFIHMNT